MRFLGVTGLELLSLMTILDLTIVVGDGSYLLLNGDLYSAVITDKLIVILLNNGGFAVIDKLQTGRERELQQPFCGYTNSDTNGPGRFCIAR